MKRRKYKKVPVPYVLSFRTSEEVGDRLVVLAHENGHDNVSLEARKILERELGVKRDAKKNGK